MRSQPPEPDPHDCLERVVEALRLVALPPDRQAAALPEFVHVPDEVVLVYHDAWLLVPRVREAKLLDDEQHDALARLDRHHRELSSSDDARLWTLEAMRTDGRWAQSRQLAADGLAALGRGDR